VQRFYLCTFLPSLLACGDNGAHVIAGARGPIAWAYEANRGFDLNKRGYITVSDLADAAYRAVGPRTRELMQRVQVEQANRRLPPTVPEIPPT
jgi:hypothetical protein